MAPFKSCAAATVTLFSLILGFNFLSLVRGVCDDDASGVAACCGGSNADTMSLCVSRQNVPTSHSWSVCNVTEIAEMHGFLIEAQTHAENGDLRLCKYAGHDVETNVTGGVQGIDIHCTNGGSIVLSPGDTTTQCRMERHPSIYNNIATAFKQ